LGPSNGQDAGSVSVQITPFVNYTVEARLTDAVTSQLRKQIQRDGTYHLATHDDGDVVVTGEIVGYDRMEMSVAPKDALTTRDYRLAITAHVKAVERSSGKVVADQNVKGFTIIRVNNDLTSSERQALPLLAGDLARGITALLADGTW
jgi:hypothetical protein